jgi:hypothetical protein
MVNATLHMCGTVTNLRIMRGSLAFKFAKSPPLVLFVDLFNVTRGTTNNLKPSKPLNISSTATSIIRSGGVNGYRHLQGQASAYVMCHYP